LRDSLVRSIYLIVSVVINNKSNLTAQFLVLASKPVLLFPGLVELVRHTLQLSLLVAQVALGHLIQLHRLLQARLDLDVDALQLLGALLQLPSGAVGLLQVDDEHLNLRKYKVWPRISLYFSSN
jgi:hypothetical protein